MLILTETLSPRFIYTCNTLFQDASEGITFISSEGEIGNYAGPVINYTAKPIQHKSIHIAPACDLWTEGFDCMAVELSERDDLPVLYPVECDLGFDVFGAAFFMLSRIEEYQNFEPDDMGRFAGAQSAAFKFGFLKLPVVDLWRNLFQKKIQDLWPDTKFTSPGFSAYSSIDVDSAFAYRYKGLKRTLGGFARDIVALDFSNALKRLTCKLGFSPDPFETFDYIENYSRNAGIPGLYFFLLSDFGKYDKNVPHTSLQLKALIARLKNANKMGCHPGVATDGNLDRLKMERNRMSEMIGSACENSRQHYMILKFPVTYQNLIQAGIIHDYSMGYPDQMGFRAGTSRTFKWFDLQKNEATQLSVSPFAAMDATFNKYQKLNPDQALAEIVDLIDTVQKAGGTYYSFWHNDSLSETGKWKGWRGVWEKSLEYSRLRMTKSSED
jgi:hypothetical protein